MTTDSTLLGVAVALTLLAGLCASASSTKPTLDVQQITFGPKHHFFGYIGHVRTIPWNASGRYILALQTDFQDHMPAPHEAADIILIDTQRDYAIRAIDRTRAWNFQQGTMLYWSPEAPETQLFFNDRDPATGKVFTVLFDIAQGPTGGRLREFRYDDTPFGNSGVGQNGGYFLGLNYGRLARLRPVTGYPGALDWTAGVRHPADDGIFRVTTATGERRLLVSFAQLRDALQGRHPNVAEHALFINHTLSNRDDDRIYFYVRGAFDDRERRVNIPCTINPDGTGLTEQQFIGGHPEWELGHRMIGASGDRLVLYDTDTQETLATIGGPSIFPRPGGDTALSPDAEWIVSGYNDGSGNAYVLYRRSDGAWARTRHFDQAGFISGDLRCDPAPCWNRDGTQVLFPSIAEDAERTRQLFLIRLP
jgi:hypothetical protein